MPRSRTHSAHAQHSNESSAHAGLSKIVGRLVLPAAGVTQGFPPTLTLGAFGGGRTTSGSLASAASFPLHSVRGLGEAFLSSGCDRGIFPPRLPVIRGLTVAAVQAVARVAARAVEEVQLSFGAVFHAQQSGMEKRNERGRMVQERGSGRGHAC